MRPFLIAFLLAGCAVSPKPQPVPAPTPAQQPAAASSVQDQRERDLAAARAEYERDPNSADAIIWVGRRLGYLARYAEAIETFSEGIRKHPNDARMYRHRGHRYITTRDFDAAIRDLEKAAKLTAGKADQIEPDGLPNARNIPTSSLQSNICYHLGLAWYLKGDFERALPVYRQCAAKAAGHPDRLVSVAHWLYMTLRRLGRAQEAEAVVEPISSSMDVIENTSYHKLALMYRGEIAPDELMSDELKGNDRATMLYGIGNWYLYNGQPEKAREIFQSIVANDPPAAFGYIAAEAELKRVTSNE